MLMVFVCGGHRAPCPKKNIFVIVIVVSTKIPRGDTFSSNKTEKTEQTHNFTSPFFFSATVVR